MNQALNDKSFTTTISVDQSPKEAFDAINNVRGWWSEQIDGNTDKLNETFLYHYKDVHISKIKLIEFVPEKKVVWQILENHFGFTKDKTEWKDTKIIFEISKVGTKTQIQFTHLGLVPTYECFEICNEAWTNYINNSLSSLIATGKGSPNPKDGEGFNAKIVEKWNLGKEDFNINFFVDQSPEQVFSAFNNVQGWWIETINGSSKKLNDEFSVQFWDLHYSKQKLIEVVPNEKVVWLVTESNLTFLKDKNEWTGTKIILEISKEKEKTKVSFTHYGLVPKIECYGDCSNAWTEYINKSLKDFIVTGKGQPTAQ